MFAFDGEGGGRGANNIVKAKSCGEDSRATGGLFSNLPHFQINKTKQHKLVDCHYLLSMYKTSVYVHIYAIRQCMHVYIS